jgi:hypothetical protein
VDARITLTIFSGAAGVFALYRLVAGRLLKIYPWFAALLVAGALQGLLLLAGDASSRAYTVAWGVTIPIILAVRIAAVAEAWRLLLNSYPGGEVLAKRLAVGSVLVALSVSLVNGLDGLGFSHTSAARIAFHVLSVGLRYSYSTLCVVCGLLWAWAALFRVGVTVNLFRHLGILTGYFACNTAGYLIINLRPGSALWVGAFTAGASAAWYVLWGVLFYEDGERRYAGTLDGRIEWLSSLRPGDPFGKRRSVTPGRLSTQRW